MQEFQSKEEINKLIEKDKHLKSFVSENLSEGDKITAAIHGYIGKAFGQKEETQRNGILICTNNVVAFKCKGLFTNITRSISIKNISSIDLDKQFGVWGRIAFHSASDSIIVNGTDLDESKNFKLLVENTRDNLGTSQTSGVEENPIDKIKQLSQLKDEGIISKEEFEEKKKELLKEI